MTSSNQQITRCPKCGTAFRITQTQLQSAKGAVRCGSCLAVFKAVDYLIAPPQKLSTSSAASTSSDGPIQSLRNADLPPGTSPKVTPSVEPAATMPPSTSILPPAETGRLDPEALLTKAPEQPAILRSIKPLSVDPLPPVNLTASEPNPNPNPKQPVVRVIDKSSLSEEGDILISDDMDDTKVESHPYAFDDFIDIDVNPKSEVSLFERKTRGRGSHQELQADESWAETLIEDEEIPRFVAQRQSVVEENSDFYAADQSFDSPVNSPSPNPTEQPPQASSAPPLIFSLVGESENSAYEQEQQHALREEANPVRTTPTTGATSGSRRDEETFELSDELASIPNHTGFQQAAPTRSANVLDPTLFETPESDLDEGSPKRQVKTQPKLRAYDGSRTALLKNIIPAPIELTAKRVHHWYQRKLWPVLSLVALLALVGQLAWLKFDYFSRVEPYRTAYTLLCPYLGCEVPTLVDTQQISAFNLVVREHSDVPGALAVDVMIMNNAPFDQPYPDLVLVFTDINENQVASRRFSPSEYLGGEAAGSYLMEQKRPVHITLDLVDPGEKAVNYHIYVPHK